MRLQHSGRPTRAGSTTIAWLAGQLATSPRCSAFSPWSLRSARLLRTDRDRRVINRVGGVILVALGIRSAASLA
ncbi:hypothetical protein ACWEOZ_05020 [Actinoplanes sp. NPDC004185]